MLKKIKAFVEPLERLLTTHGVRGPQKSTSLNTTCNSQLSHSTKQCADLQKQFVESNFPLINAQENSKLCNFIEQNFGLFNNKFNYFSQPVPVASWNSNQLHIQSRIGLFHNPVSLSPIGLKNVFVANNSRKFSTLHTTSMVNNATNCGGNAMFCLGFKPFFNLLNKPDSLFSKYNFNNNLDQKIENKNANSLKKNEFKFHEKSIGHKLFDQSDKATLNIDKRIKINNNNSKAQDNNAMTIYNDNIFDHDDEILDRGIDYNTRNTQYYMTFVVTSPPPLWSLNSMATSISNISNISDTSLFHKKSPDIQQLNDLIVKGLRENSELYYNHMKEITSILEKLLQHGNYEIKIFGYELRVNFPRGMQIEEIENLLKSLGIDPTNPHFELEMINFEDSIFISPEILNVKNNDFNQLGQYYHIDDDNINDVLFSSSDISSTFPLFNISSSNIQLGQHTTHEEEINSVDENDIQNFIASIDKLSEVKLDFFKSDNAIKGNYIEF